MARKGKIEIGASVTVGAKEDGSLSQIEKRIEKLSNEEIEINIKSAAKRLQELDRMEQKLGKNMASNIEATRKQLTDLIEQCKQEQKLRAENLKQVEQEVKAAKELQKIEEKTAKTQKQKTNGPTKREQELAAITKGVKGIRGVVNTFDDSKIQKTEEKVRKLIGALDEYQTKLDAMKRLRKGNERTMYDTAKSEIADLKRALGAIQAVKDQTPSVKPKIEKKEKEVEQEKPKKTVTQQPAVGVGDSAKSIQEQTAKIEQQASSMKKLGNAAEQTGKQISTVLNKAVKKYNEIMSSIDADSVIGGTGGATIENIGGLKGMLQKAKRIYDMYYESGTTFSDQRNGTQQEKALWKSETAALRGFLTSYSKYVDDSAEAIYAKIQGKKKEFDSYKLPEWNTSEMQDNEKFLAFKREELSIYEKRLEVSKELYALQQKYNGATSYTPNWNKGLGLDLTKSTLANYEEEVKAAKISLERAIEDVEIKKARLAKQTTAAQEQEAASTARNNNLEHYNQLVQECIQLTGELSDAVAKHARVQREMANILQSGNIIPQELKDAREQIEEVISGYFKKDFFEPTLSTDGILMWLQSTEAAAISIDRLVDSVEVKYKQMLAAQSELDNTSKINSETTAIQTNAQAVEENIKVKKKQNKIKVRDLTREEYDAVQEKFQQENDGAVEVLEETVDIIRQASQFGTKFETQIITSCKRATTAVKRFFSAIDPNKYPAIADWKDSILESVQNSYFSQKEMYNGMYTGQYSWGVEAIDEDRYYVFLNFLDVAKDKEEEYSAYLNEEFRKRDEGLKKEAELLAKIYARYAQLHQLHSYNPKWDNNDQITSIKNRLSYYTQERVLLQDIVDLKKDLNSIDGKYKSRNTADALRAYTQNLYLGDYGNATLAENERATAVYRAELESAIKRLDKKNTALNNQNQVETIEQQASATEELAQANNNLANSYLKVQEAAKKSLDVTDGSTFATILKYYKELLNAPQDNKTIAAQKALIEKAFNGAKTPSALSALQFADDSELAAMGNKLMIGASFEGEFLFKQIGAYLQDMVGSTIDWGKALAQSNDNVASSAEQAARQIEQQATANKEVADTSERVSQAQEKISIGYHAGDLGKAEWYGNHAYGSRDTGHFGTGTYFVGNPKQIEGYNKRNGVPAPVEQVDFSKYNLFKPETTQQAYDLHRALSLINSDLISLHKYDGLDLPLLKEQLENGDESGVQGFINKYLDESTRNRYEAQALQYKERLESATEESIRADVESNYMKSFRDLGLSDDDLLLLDDDMINEEIERQLMEWRNALANFNLDSRMVQEIIYDIEHEEFDGIQEIQSLKDNISDRLSNIFTNLTKEQIADALEKTYETISQYKQGDFYKLDSASTVFMKSLGYEGVDVRHTKLDNTAYGSVIYDLKGKDLERRQEILKLAEAKVPVTPVIEPKAAQNAIEKSTGGAPVEVPVTPVVEEAATTQVSNDIINKLINGANIEQILTKYSIPSNKFDTGVDLFKDFAGALYQEDGKVGGEKVNEAFAQLADFIEKNAERTEQVTKTLEEFYQYMDKRQIRIPENMEESFAAEFTDEWKNIKKRFAIGGNYQNKKRLIATSKYASTPDVLLEELLANGFGHALGIDKSFNGSAQDSLRIILDAVQRAKDEAKLGKTQKITGLDMEAQAAMYGDLSEAASVVEQNYLALNAATSAVNASNDDTTESAEQTGEALKNQARSAEDAAKAMEGLQNQEQIDEKSVFPAEKVETEIDRIRKAIHSSEIGLDQIANTEGLQAAVATYVKSLDEIDDKKFKLISADINEMAEGVDRVTLKFQSLEDENVKLAQTWAMDDGNLTLGRLRTTKTFVDSESNFDTELERAVANSKVDVLQSQLIGIDHVSQKVTDSLTSLRTAAGNISSDSDIKTFTKNFQVAQNYVKEFKNEYKTLGSLANETQNAQAKMANAQETINAQISSSAKYIGVEGYDKVTQSIGNMTSALSKYNEAQKNISDGGLDAEAISKYEKQMADAFTEYNKAEKQLGAAMKEVRANANFDSFSKSMKDAEIIIDTAKLKLDKFGELEGVDKANGYIKDMTEAWKKFNDADSTIEDKAQAVKDFEAAQKSLAKQMQYLNTEDAWWRKVADENPSEPSDNSIEKYAKALTSTFQQINEIGSKIYSLELKDNGSGVWSPLISSLEMQKADLLNKVQNIAQQINTTFNDSFVQGDKIEFPFSTLMNNLNDDVGTSGIIENFFNDVRTQTTLTEQSIDKFISTLQNGQNKAEEFAITLAEKLSTASKAAKTLSILYQSGMVSSQNEQYKGGVDKLFAYNEYKSSLPQDVTAWSPEQISTIQKMASELSNYVSELDKAISKEAKYFESKKQYANIVNMKDYDAMASSIDNVSKSSSRAKEDLEEFVTKFTGGRGIITGFTTSIDGISKINFGVLEEGTNQFRTFSAEMGTFTDKVYTYETSIKNMTAGAEAAKKALASMSQVMSRLNANGFTVDNNDYVKSLYEKMQSLRGALAKTGTSKDAGDQSNLQNMANDANRAIKALAALENAWLKVNSAVADGDSEVVGSIGKNEDVYKKMVQLAQDVSTAMPGSTLSIDGFNQKTKELTYTIEGADGQVKTFVMSMDKLSGSAVASVTKIDKAKTGLQEFLGGIGDTGKQLLQYGLRMVEVYDIIRYLRQGFNEVLEIDTAMTELKKVTDETAVAYDNFAKSAYESSRKIGSTMKEFIQATSDFARLGYDIDEASQLAEAANVYKNVGDGIDDVAQASESIISTMKAFNIEATDSMGIVDRFNEIGNNFAIDSVGIGEALQRSASALAEAGNSIDESIALVTAANSVVQNPEQVGTALKTLALRLRGTKTELEEAGLETDNMAESTSQLQAKLLALTHGKVNIMKSATEFKNTTEILREMSQAWQDMTDIERADCCPCVQKCA